MFVVLIFVVFTIPCPRDYIIWHHKGRASRPFNVSTFRCHDPSLPQIIYCRCWNVNIVCLYDRTHEWQDWTLMAEHDSQLTVRKFLFLSLSLHSRSREKIVVSAVVMKSSPNPPPNYHPPGVPIWKGHSYIKELSLHSLVVLVGPGVLCCVLPPSLAKLIRVYNRYIHSEKVMYKGT